MGWLSHFSILVLSLQCSFAPVQYDPEAAHGHPGHIHKFLDKEEMKDQDHIKEHFDEIDPTAKLERQQLIFYYFKMHDFDNNNLIDGLDLVKSFTHEHKDGIMIPNDTPMNDAQLEELVDSIMKIADKNIDGYIDWSEYQIMGEWKAEA